ncbi:MAG: N-acetyltransferase [Clostridia bacterium]|jgi:RimJ/RimL family protein N-acetyltransferase|nr:N-acetyltransferase [Clostridia bacterium]
MEKMLTERLILRQFLPSDWEDLFEYLSIPEVVLYEPYGLYTKDECIDEAKERHEEQNNRFWAVCLQDSKKMIGHVYFAQSEPSEFRTWEIGYVFNPIFYGQGYATEACKRIVEYGFQEKNAHRIVAGVNVKNQASWKVLERLNMRREAHMLENVFFKKSPDGEPIWNDSYRYAILYKEYIAMK